MQYSNFKLFLPYVGLEDSSHLPSDTVRLVHLEGKKSFVCQRTGGFIAQSFGMDNQSYGNCHCHGAFTLLKYADPSKQRKQSSQYSNSRLQFAAQTVFF